MWLDGLGRMQRIRAARDDITGIVSSEFVDDLAEGGPEFTRWQFEFTGADEYVERLFVRRNQSWEFQAEWRFKRSPSTH